jgi:hypothetical protein
MTTTEQALEAEGVLANADPDILRGIISRLANLTPGAVYWSEDFMQDIKDKELLGGGKMPPLAQAGLMLATQLSGRLDVGAEATFQIKGAIHGGKDCGDWKIVAFREK